MESSAIISIIVALISSGGTLVGVILSNKNNTLKMINEMEKQQLIYKAELEKQQITNKAELEKTQAVINTQIQELTREVREHNHFAQRIPVVEEQIKVANHRIQDLEKQNK